MSGHILELSQNVERKKVVYRNRYGLDITGEGILSVLEVQMEGKRRMRTEDFLRGYEVMEDTVLSQS